MRRPERQVVITSNSPGEVATWLRPFLPALRRREPGAHICVFLPPCTFASGSERSVVESYPEVDLCAGPSEVLAYVLFGRRPDGFEPGKRGAVLFLGGDMAYAVRLGRRLGFPAFAFTEGKVYWPRAFERFFVPDELGRQRALQDGATPGQVEVVGDLMADAVRLPQPAPEAGEEVAASVAVEGAGEDIASPVDVEPAATGPGSESPAGGGTERERPARVALFPGSRPVAIRHVLPFLLRVAERVSSEMPHAEWTVSLSPFVAWEQAEQILRRGSDLLEGSVGRLVVPNEGDAAPDRAHIVTERGLTVTVARGRPYEAMRWADLGVTIPGSNTAEMGHLRLPMLVLLPLNRPELLPLEGLPGVIGSIPVLGKAMKRAAVRKIEAQTEWVALPNRKAGKEVVPEMRGTLQAETVARRVIELLSDDARRRGMKGELADAMGSAGAAERIAERIVEEGIECRRRAG